MSKSEVMDLTVACQSFPILYEPQIDRENIIQTINEIFEKGVEVVFLEGRAGMGKTTLLAQFARANSMRTFSLFIKPVSPWAYDPLVLQLDLCNQLHWFLDRTELADPDDVDEGFLRTHLFRLNRRSKKSKQLYVFLVDGLSELPEAGRSLRRTIIDMLPLGREGFRFLFSGDAESFVELHEGLATKSYPLSGFTLNQTISYLTEFSLSFRDAEEIHRISSGLPGHLASIRRILMKDVGPQELIREMPLKLPDLFEIEWRQVDIDDEPRLLALAIIAHDRRQFPISEISKLVGLEEREVYEFGDRIYFLEVEPTTGLISFVSETFRDYAAGKLVGKKEQVHKLLIEDLMNEPESIDSLNYLPGYFEKLGRYDELLAYLNRDNLMLMLHLGQSVIPVKQKLELGLTTAMRTGRNSDLLRFALQNSAMKIVSDIGVWRSEVEALMAVDDYESALALAQGMIFKEDRLNLLAVISKNKHKSGISIDFELDEQIKQLCKSIDATILGERAVDIAADLIQTHPDLAIELVEDSLISEDDENALDWAMARLSIRTLGWKHKEPEPIDVIDRIRQRIRDPRALSFSTTISLMIEEYSADEVIAKIESLDRTSDKLYLLRLWAVENRESEGAWEVIEIGLQTLLANPDYAPNARVFRELATPLPYVEKQDVKQRLIGTFDAQRASIERSGPTEEYVRLELILAHAESTYSMDSARNRLVETFHYIISLEDLATQVSCMALFLAFLNQIDTRKVFEPSIGIHTIAEDELEKIVKKLLLNTSDHYYLTKNAVKALSKTRPDLALSIASMLNTEPRRDNILLEFVESAINRPEKDIDLNNIVTAIDRIVSLELQSKAIFKSVARLARFSTVTSDTVNKTLPLLSKIEKIDQAGLRCNTYCLSLEFISRCENNSYKSLENHLLKRLDFTWKAIDPGYARVEAGFNIVESLAAHFRDLAINYLQETNNFRDEILIDSHETASAYLGCLKLIVRAFGGLIRSNTDAKENIDTLSSLLDELHSCGHRANLWGELALYYFLNDR